VSTNESAPITPLLDVSVDSPPQPEPVAVIDSDPDNPPWGVLQALLVWLVSAAMLILVPLVLMIPYVFYYVLTHGSQEGLAQDPNLILVTIVAVVPSHALTLLVVWFVVTKRGRLPFLKTLGWRWPKEFGPWKTIGFAVLLLIGGWILTHFVPGAETQIDQIVKSSYKARFVVAFLAAVSAPLVEEFVYRGVLYSAVRRSFGVLPAIIGVTVMFAGVHIVQYYNNIGVIAVITMLSFALTLVRAKTKSILPSYVIHLVFNGIQAIFLITQPLIERVIKSREAAGTVESLIIHSASLLT
jgi:membrane protease YdiL (CAAX protease family)